MEDETEDDRRINWEFQFFDILPEGRALVKEKYVKRVEQTDQKKYINI